MCMYETVAAQIVVIKYMRLCLCTVVERKQHRFGNPKTNASSARSITHSFPQSKGFKFAESNKFEFFFIQVSSYEALEIGRRI